MLRLQYDNRYYPFNVQNESVVFLVEYSTRLLSASASVLFQISLILLLSSNHYLDQPPHLQTHLHQAQRGEGRARRRRGLGKQQWNTTARTWAARTARTSKHTSCRFRLGAGKTVSLHLCIFYIVQLQVCWDEAMSTFYTSAVTGHCWRD